MVPAFNRFWDMKQTSKLWDCRRFLTTRKTYNFLSQVLENAVWISTFDKSSLLQFIKLCHDYLDLQQQNFLKAFLARYSWLNQIISNLITFKKKVKVGDWEIKGNPIIEMALIIIEFYKVRKACPQFFAKVHSTRTIKRKFPCMFLLLEFPWPLPQVSLFLCYAKIYTRDYHSDRNTV